MEPAEPSTSSEVMLFLDGGDLYVRGDQTTIDLVLADLVGADDATRGRSLTRLAESGAAAASIAALAQPVEELFRLTPEGLAKLAQHGEQLTDGGALRGFVRGSAGHFAGDLSFEKVAFGAEQALAVETAAVSLALRSAIADVQAAVEAVDEKVSDIQRKVRAREIGEVVGTYRFLQKVVASTIERGHLLEADWDLVAGSRRDLEIALESLRAYVAESINDLDPSAPLPKRETAIKRIASNKGVAGSLHLILVAEQALHLLEFLRLERVRTTDPGQVSSALADAKRSLATQRELDAKLVQSAVAGIEMAKEVDPLEIYRLISIPRLEKSSMKAFDKIEAFAVASRTDLPDFDRAVCRPELAEARTELKRHSVNARDEVIDGSKILGQAVSRSAKRTSRSVQRKVRRKLG